MHNLQSSGILEGIIQRSDHIRIFGVSESEDGNVFSLCAAGDRKGVILVIICAQIFSTGNTARQMKSHTLAFRKGIPRRVGDLVVEPSTTAITSRSNSASLAKAAR
jgi:hypothetical protein